MAINAYSERFLQVIDKLGVTDYFVWNNCDSISKAQMSHIRTGKGGASLSIIEAFCNQFPQVNANYILTGKGSMFLNDENNSVDSLKTSDSQKMFEDIIKGREKEISDLKDEIARMKSEIDKLTGQNDIMREQLGIGGRKASSKTA